MSASRTSTFDLSRRKYSMTFNCLLLHAVANTSPTVDVSSTWTNTDCTSAASVPAVTSSAKYYLCSVLPPPCCGHTLYNVNVEITEVLPCLLTAALGTTKITLKHSLSIRFYTEAHVTTMLSRRTTWRHNAVTIR